MLATIVRLIARGRGETRDQGTNGERIRSADTPRISATRLLTAPPFALRTESDVAPKPGRCSSSRAIATPARARVTSEAPARPPRTYVVALRWTPLLEAHS